MEAQYFPVRNSLPRGLGGKSRPVHPGGESRMLGSQGNGASVQPCLLNCHIVCTSMLVLLSGVGVQGTIPPPTPRVPGAFDSVWRPYWLAHLGEGMLLASSGRGQERCSASHNAQDGPQEQNLSSPKCQ